MNTQARIDEVDPITQDSQKRLDALRLQDESSSGRDQRRTDRLNQVSIHKVVDASHGSEISEVSFRRPLRHDDKHIKLVPCWSYFLFAD